MIGVGMQGSGLLAAAIDCPVWSALLPATFTMAATPW